MNSHFPVVPSLCPLSIGTLAAWYDYPASRQGDRAAQLNAGLVRDGLDLVADLIYISVILTRQPDGRDDGHLFTLVDSILLLDGYAHSGSHGLAHVADCEPAEFREVVLDLDSHWLGWLEAD